MKKDKYPITIIDSDNKYLQKNYESFSRLKKIYEGEIAYVSDDYPVLINCLERLYKGIAKELQAIYPDKFNFTDDDYKMGHKFTHFARAINKIIPLSANRDGYFTVLESLGKIENQYTDARFDKDFTINDFYSTFGRYERQFSRLSAGLEVIKNREERESADIELEDF